MTIRIKKSPRDKIFELFKYRTGLTRSHVAEIFGITYWSARYYLDKFAELGLIRKEIIQIDHYRRVFYYTIIIKEYYYRTQVALLFYTEKPRSKTPDPIAEFRCTVVSDKPRQYDIEEFKTNCIYVGVIMAPQTWWARPDTVESDKPRISHEVTAYEWDEPIDKDELVHSVTVYGKLNYTERQAVFFKSRQYDMWRKDHLYYWLEKIFPTPRLGDYLYTEDKIKAVESNRVALGTLKKKFDNLRGVMENV